MQTLDWVGVGVVHKMNDHRHLKTGSKLAVLPHPVTATKYKYKYVYEYKYKDKYVCKYKYKY